MSEELKVHLADLEEIVPEEEEVNLDEIVFEVDEECEIVEDNDSQDSDDDDFYINDWK